MISEPSCTILRRRSRPLSLSFAVFADRFGHRFAASRRRALRAQPRLTICSISKIALRFDTEQKKIMATSRTRFPFFATAPLELLSTPWA